MSYSTEQKLLHFAIPNSVQLKLIIMKKYPILIGTAMAVSSLFFIGCGNEQKPIPEAATVTETAEAAPDPMLDKGIGPITTLNLREVDKTLAEKGKVTFESKCVACHKIDAKLLGPALAGVANRRSPEWIMNMILNPEEMTKNNEIAKQLLKDHGNVQMTNQQLSQDQAREVLEFLRTI